MDRLVNLLQLGPSDVLRTSRAHKVHTGQIIGPGVPEGGVNLVGDESKCSIAESLDFFVRSWAARVRPPQKKVARQAAEGSGPLCSPLPDAKALQPIDPKL